MNLSQHIASIPLLRDTAEPDGHNPLALVILSDQLPKLPGWLKERKNFRISKIFIADLQEKTPVSFTLPARHGQPKIICGLSGLEPAPGEDIVFLFPAEYLLRHICMHFPTLALNKIWLAGNLDQALQCRPPAPGFYKDNLKQLNMAYELLDSFADKNTFAARIKAIETGNPGYLPLASHMEYEHPQIGPKSGEIMIDGGISDMVWAQEKFCKTIGPNGMIHGFEPIKWMALKAEEQLSAYANYAVHCAGLGEVDGEAFFDSLHDSSHISEHKNAGSERCQLVSIDNFARNNNISTINCLKLDVEGSELAALKGAKDSILKNKPTLIICLYHKPQDLYEIPLFIHNLAPDYIFHLAHSSCGFTDTILYAETTH